MQDPPPDAATDPATRSVGGARLVVQTLVAVALLFALVAVLEHFARARVVALGDAFVRRLGLPGMFLGTFLADGFHFPVPPQFYLLAAITSGRSQPAALATICAASLLAGWTGYLLSRRLGRLPRVERLLTRSRARVDALFARYGYWAIGIGALTPVPYSTLCYLSGLYRVPARPFAFLVLLRIPRILFFYYLIRAGWR